MASQNTLYRRMAADVDKRRTERMLWPTPYTNRGVRRAAAACAKRGPSQTVKPVDETQLPPPAAAQSEIESEAPT